MPLNVLIKNNGEINDKKPTGIIGDNNNDILFLSIDIHHQKNIYLRIYNRKVS